MAMELICGHCQGRLLVETPGVTVACPHCGTHLLAPAASIPVAFTAPAPAAAAAEELTVKIDPATDSSGGDSGTVSMLESPWEPFAGFAEPGAELDALPSAEGAQEMTVSDTDSVPWKSRQDEQAAWLPPADMPSFGEFDRDTGGGSLPDFEMGEVVPPMAAPEFPAPTQIASPPVVEAIPATPVAPAEVAEPTKATEAVAAVATLPAEPRAESPPNPAPVPAQPAVLPATSPAPAADVSRPAAPAPLGKPEVATAALVSPTPTGPSPFLVKMVFSYASVATLACLYLLYLLWTAPSRSPSLDLPDLAPPVKRDKDKKVTTTALLYIPPDQKLPPGNMLRLSDSRRFGSIVVTPLRVTRGPLEFTYYQTDSKETRPPTTPVLKLHLQIRNASIDQEFVPLDRQLVFTKEPDSKRQGRLVANNFVCPAAKKKNLSSHVLVYDLSPDSPWIIKDENLDRELKPGDYIETFIPTTEEGLDSLEGALVWRVHFRKGYNRDSYRGVTTLIEVYFDSNEIVNETPPQNPSKDA